jgi:SAM-dependent methyltransferase
MVPPRLTGRRGAAVSILGSDRSRYHQTVKRAPEWRGMLFPDIYVTKFFFKFGLDKAPGSMLELGCGNGNNARLFTEYGWRVTGLDMDAAALDNARANWDQEPADNWSFVERDLREGLPPLEGPFDALVGNGSLFYFERHYLEDLLAEARTVLAPGAHVYFKFRTLDDWRYGKGDEVEKDTFRINIWQTAEEGATMAFYDADDLRALIESRLGTLQDCQVLFESHENIQHDQRVENRDVIVWGRL